MNTELPVGEHQDLARSSHVSATFKPSSLTFGEVLRLVLASNYPRARNPVLAYFTVLFFLVVWLGCAGLLLGLVAGPNIRPEYLGIVTASSVLLLPFRLFSVTQRNLGMLRARGPSTIEVDETGLTRRSDHRYTHHDWEGVVRIHESKKELVFLFDAGDIAWFPRRAFLDPDHEARFLEVARAGLARAARNAPPTTKTSDR